MEDGLLNISEIEYILKEAKSSLLNNPNIIGKFTKHWLDIFSISPNKKLIFIEGDNYTGLNHINERHRFYTNAHSQIGNKFKKTSRFDAKSGTLDDYIKISEDLCDNENLNLINNKNPDKLDLYEKRIDFLDKRIYRLLLYKNTKIVHTLFPIEPGKKATKYRKGNVIIENRDNNSARIVIPYADKNHIICYGIGVQIFSLAKIERWDLLKYEDSNLLNVIHLFENPYTCRFNIEVRFQQINFQDVSNIEKLIYDSEKI